MTLLYLLDMIGTAAFAISGALAGVRREMDLLGVVVLGTVTAIGGGTLRDIILGSTPPFSFVDETYFIVSVVMSLIVFYLFRLFDKFGEPLIFFDAVGLGTFVVIGCQKAHMFHIGPVGAVILGVMTATAGGIIRDMLSGRIPMILQREVYASACIVGGVLMVVMLRFEVNPVLTLVLPAFLVTMIRLLANYYNWSLPKRPVG